MAATTHRWLTLIVVAAIVRIVVFALFASAFKHVEKGAPGNWAGRPTRGLKRTTDLISILNVSQKLLPSLVLEGNSAKYIIHVATFRRVGVVAAL